MKNSLAFLIVCFCLWTSCNKDEKTTIEILAAHTWKISAATISPGITNPANGSLITDLLGFVGGCLGDNLYSFTLDGKYIDDEGPTKCNPADPQLSTSTLTISADGKTFTADGTVYTFESIAENKIVFTFAATVNGTAQTVKFTLIPK